MKSLPTRRLPKSLVPVFKKLREHYDEICRVTPKDSGTWLLCVQLRILADEYIITRHQDLTARKWIQRVLHETAQERGRHSASVLDSLFDGSVTRAGKIRRRKAWLNFLLKDY